MNCSFCHNHDMFYAKKLHNHDSRYYTEGEADTLLAGKAPTSHTHDDRYYTEGEVDGLISTINAAKVSKLIASDGNPNPALSIDASGYISAAVQPLFFARLSSATATNKTGDDTAYKVIFDVKDTDRNSNYNAGTGNFTAPVTGNYCLAAQVDVYGLTSTHNSGLIQLVASGISYYFFLNPWAAADSGFFPYVVNVPVVRMSAGDTAYINVRINSTNSAKVIGVWGGANAFTWFAGYLQI